MADRLRDYMVEDVSEKTLIALRRMFDVLKENFPSAISIDISFTCDTCEIEVHKQDLAFRKKIKEVGRHV